MNGHQGQLLGQIVYYKTLPSTSVQKEAGGRAVASMRNQAGPVAGVEGEDYGILKLTGTRADLRRHASVWVSHT